jgi:hypothetical protein
VGVQDLMTSWNIGNSRLVAIAVRQQVHTFQSPSSCKLTVRRVTVKGVDTLDNTQVSLTVESVSTTDHGPDHTVTMAQHSTGGERAGSRSPRRTGSSSDSTKNRPSRNGLLPVSRGSTLHLQASADFLDGIDFSKTLFTPAGLDVYMRRPLAEAGDAGRTQLERIVEAITASMDKTIAQMASEGGFMVGHP